MFTKIKKIDNYAVFINFDWNAAVRDKENNVAEFKDINIIYGRNYSGKTTLSRMFRSLEKGKMNEKYPNATFEFEHTGTDRMCHLDVANCSYDIRVYNRDYISENLKLLIDEDGAIQPFAILGESNVAIENEIAEKEKIEVTKEEIEEWTKKFAEEYKMEKEKADQLLGTPQKIKRIQENILEDKVVDFLLKNAIVKEETLLAESSKT